MNTSNVNLKVPFNEKDQAKALGARWNAELKLWYVPEGLDSAPFEKWLLNTDAPIKSATKATAPRTAAVDDHDDDMDAINARFREAYESREYDVL
ncbi:MAG: DUF5710 domain-containing protein [Methylotenera sp.]|nr:DUF5710 domain-containing protein [Methylotenera sp.]MDO9234395.1 DUF5710 domain-containing protein [Methylotenera sp.]MDO9389169.1 DUF5710 domain-containing protein [Methylotenera sp.]MDP2103009.1 DUF5710 domain-containing protein [Methylotenera sp.]MDP2282293.1 DUF5710 domain-containing protein [Methylotenera sp.]